MAGKIITLRFPGRCADCGARLEPGYRAHWFKGGKLIGIGCHAENEWDDGDRFNPDSRAHANAEYAAGIADGERYIAEKAIYGEALAERFAFEDEFNRYWKHGEDY